jgi:signal peptidase
VVGGLLTGLCVVLAGLMLVPAALGLQRYVIVGDSMGGAYARGSLVLEEVVPTTELERGDVITYDPPAGTGPAGVVTHRIVRISEPVAGRLVFQTKGDANRTSDPWKFTLGPTQARAVLAIPLVGYVYAGLSERWVRMVAIGLPALLLGGWAALRLWREDEPEPAAA